MAKYCHICNYFFKNMNNYKIDVKSRIFTKESLFMIYISLQENN